MFTSSVLHKKRNYACSRRSRAKRGREMYRKVWCTCKDVVSLIIWRSRYRPRRWILKPLIIHKMRGDQERPNRSVFKFSRPFDLIIEYRMSLSPVHSPYPSIDKEIKTTFGYWSVWALKDVHRGRPLTFPFIPNIILILGTPCDLSCSSSRLTMIKSCLHADVSYFLCCSRKRDVARSNAHLYPFTMSFNGRIESL